MRKRLLAYVILPMMIVLLLSGCRYFWGGNYPILALETLSTVSGKLDEKSGFEYSLMGTLLNHGAPGEFIIRVYVFEDGNWTNKIVYGPLYINDKAEFNITWYALMPYQEKIRAEFYAIKRNGDSKKEFTIEF
ncbi:MAG: hypothetical protein ACHQYO_07210 [Halanaerobiales bacterium]